MDTLNVLIAVKYQILRDGIEKILADESDLAIKGTAKNKDELLALPLEEGGIIVLDLDLPHAELVELIEELDQKYPKTATLVISEEKNPEYVKRIMQSGASGYVLKQQSSSDLIRAIREIGKGGKYLSDDIIGLLLQKSGDASRFDAEKMVSADLTERELEILTLICKEMTNKEIAEKLNISDRTVDTHRRNMLQKTGAKNTAGLVKYAIKNQIYSL